MEFSEPAASQRLSDRYRLIDRIGRGGVGEVYRGWQVQLERSVAIKVLRPELTRNAAVLARFEREARTACRLNHPNVVTVYDVGESDDGARFLVMELLEGETLAELLGRRKALPVELALGVARQIVRGMGAGQGVGLVHRDLKPENIFLVGGSLVKILDFGLATLRLGSEDGAGARDTPAQPPIVPQVDARATFSLEPEPGPVESTASSPRLTNPGTLLGTPRYLSPEQALGWEADHRSDLYSFGCILFEMLSGAAPFPGPSGADFIYQHIHQPPASLARLAPEVPRPLVRVIERLLHKSPSARYPDWTALAEALRRVDLSPAPRAAPRLAASEDTPRPTEPYRFLSPFQPDARAIFFGRDADARRLLAAWEHPDRVPLVLITGASGVGKSSFIGARVVPGLLDTGHRVLRVGGGARPLETLSGLALREVVRSGEVELSDRSLPALLDRLSTGEGRPVAVLLDQVEEVFTLGSAEDAAAFQAGLAALITSGDDRVRFVLSLREDYLGALLRALHPLPVDALSRTVPLRPLGAEDLAEALEGPGREGLPVAYAPFSFAPGLVVEIIADLLGDTSGEVAPRVAAVGSRLWEMVRNEPRPQITHAHYREGLGGARGILARILDQAVSDLGPGDAGVARELLRALTHLPGRPTSRPAPERELVGHAADQERRRRVLRRLEDGWRVVQGYADPRWPAERSYRLAHEALVSRIQQYGEEGSEQNRARQIFQQGLGLWLQGGRREEELLTERHFDEVQRYIEDLVLRTAEERDFYAACLQLHNDGWERRLLDQRRARRRRGLLFTLAPLLVFLGGFLVGQFPVRFVTLKLLMVRGAAALGVSRLDLRGVDLRAAQLSGLRLAQADLSEADLRQADLRQANLRAAGLQRARLEGADLRDADLREADLTGARLWGAGFAGADLSGALVDAWRDGADFAGARFDLETRWGQGSPPLGALGPGGDAGGVIANGAQLEGAELSGLSATGASLSGAELAFSNLSTANLDRAGLEGADLREARLERASLVDANLRSAVLDRADLSGALLTRADLSGSNLVGAQLEGAVNLNTAALSGAVADGSTTWPLGFVAGAAGVIQLGPAVKLPGLRLPQRSLRGLAAPDALLMDSDFQGSDLRDARLSGADLRNANFNGADLTGAQLDGAQLCGADLRDADLTLTLFEGATDCDRTRWGDGHGPPGVLRR